MMIPFANLLCILLTYLIESLISLGSSYEFGNLCATREITVFVILSTQFQKQK